MSTQGEVPQQQTAANRTRPESGASVSQGYCGVLTTFPLPQSTTGEDIQSPAKLRSGEVRTTDRNSSSTSTMSAANNKTYGIGEPKRRRSA
jgi:hypothetical protein